MTIARRCIAVCVLLVLVRVPALWVFAGFSPEEVVLPREGLAVPMQLDAWRGEDHPMNPRLVTSLDADQLLNRNYTADDDQIAVHVARFKDLSTGTPHLPTACYGSNGWQILSQSMVDLGPSSGGLRARSLVLEQSGECVQVLYWYQLGPYSYVDAAGFRDVRKKFWNVKQWPGVTKVLLHRHVTGPEASPTPLRDFASRLALALNPGKPAGTPGS